MKTKIQQLDTQFDFVLLAEFFDESLVSLLSASFYCLVALLTAIKSSIFRDKERA